MDDQNEDVFFHVSKVRLSQPITVGQSVYFNSIRNDKNQLRAIEVTSSSLSIEPDTDTDTASNMPKHRPNNAKRNSQHSSRNSNHSSRVSNRSNQSGNQNKRSLGSTVFSLIAIIAVTFYFFGDLKSTFFADGVESTTISASKNSSPATNSGVMGDAQIDRTVALIQQGGPFPYPSKDGTTFYNREGRLPAQSQGYYREYTVPTPNVSHRGARRIVTGGYPPTVYYLTVDHYDSFRKLEVN